MLRISGIRQNVPWNTKFLIGLTVSMTILTMARAEDFPGSNGREGVIVPGIYVEELDDLPLHFYEKLVPLVFEFKMYPELSATSSTVSAEPRALPRFLCRNDGKYPPNPGWTFTCPVTYHLSALLTQLKANLTNIYPSLTLLPRPTTPRNKKFTNPNLPFEDCDALLRTEPWLGITVRDLGLGEYRTLIEKCALASYFEEEITDYNSTVNSTIYERIRDNFVLNFVNYTATEGGETAAMILGLQSLMTLQSYTEITRWREAISDCRNHLIPYSLLKFGRLDKAMKTILAQLTAQKSSYVPVLSSTLAMYNYQLADCIVGTSSLFVRVMVPVKRSAPVYKPLKVSQPQFFYNDELCTVTSKSARLSSLNLVHDKTSKVIFETPCDFSKGGFCRIPDNSDRPPRDKCINAIAAAAEKSNNQVLIDNVKTYCGIECEERVSSLDARLPLVQQVGSNKFLVTTNALTTLLIRSEGRPDEMVPPQKYGASEVTLPCNAYLMLHGDKFVPTKPCGTLQNLPVVHHALPIHMINSTFGLPFLRSGLQSARSSSYYSSRYSLLNVANYVNMTFRDKDVVEVQLGIPNPAEMEVAQTEGQGSTTRPSPFEDSLLRPCCTDDGVTVGSSGPSSLWWVVVVFQLLATAGLGLGLSYKILLLNRKLDRSQDVISFSGLQSTSQVTLADK